MKIASLSVVGGCIIASSLLGGSSYGALTASAAWGSTFQALSMPSAMPLQLKALKFTMKWPKTSEAGTGSTSGTKKQSTVVQLSNSTPPPVPLPIALSGQSLGQLVNLTGSVLPVSVIVSGIPNYSLSLSHVNLASGMTLPLVLQGPPIKTPGNYAITVSVDVAGFTETGTTTVTIGAPPKSNQMPGPAPP